MDKIRIKDLEVYGKHGVFKEENILGQKFLISLTLFLDTKEAGRSDRMEESISYAEVAHYTERFMKERTYKLLEAAAEHLAEEVLLNFSLAEKIIVEIKKPWAPILLPLDTVSVEIERKWHTAYVALGSNMGDKEKYLQDAIALLNKEESTKVTKVSSFYITEPMGEVEQDDFLNGAIEIKTLLDPQELLNLTSGIEEKLERVRKIHWGPRTIDLDIILYDEEVVDTERLKIPHIGVQDRDFVLIPLAEIAPQAEHPLLKQNVYQMKKALEQK